MESKTKEYAGIDVFRVVAAVLVAAIHISPLASYNELADMALTKIAARTACLLYTSGKGKRSQRDLSETELS